MTLEAMKAAEIMAKDGIDVEILDLRSLKPLDESCIIISVKKTGRLIAVDGAWRTAGFAAEILSLATEKAFNSLKSAPQRITFPDVPTPTSPAFAKYYYPKAIHIINCARTSIGLPERTEEELGIKHDLPLDVPDQTFRGPF
jgi:pyruvate dehydrogenase E1 component beta subunit